MKRSLSITLITISTISFSQNLSIPSGTTGITSVTNGTSNIGIGTTTPRAFLDVATSSKNQLLATVFARLPEGDAAGEGTFLGTRGYASQQDEYYGKSFAIEHSFHGNLNSSINFFRGPNVLGGFITFNTSSNTERMRIDGSGAVGIGTKTIDQAYKLNVNGKILAEELKVVVDVPADYVFTSHYSLMPLSEVSTYIQANRHLPNIPPASEIKRDGWQVGEMSNKILEKVEELTLYLIQINEENLKLKEENKLILEKLIRLETKSVGK